MESQKKIHEEDAHDTRSLILEAAEKEFFAKGFAGARTTAIAAEAGVTHAMLHYYFRTKEKLFDEIIREKIGSLGKIILSAFSRSDMPLMERVRTGVESHFDFIAANRELPRFVINEIYSNPERAAVMLEKLSEIAGELMNDLQRQIDDGVEAGTCRKVDARMLILDIVSLNLFAFVAWPILSPLLGEVMNPMELFLEKRKKENVETILKKLAL